MPFAIREVRSALHRRAMKRFPSRCASAIQIVRPSISRAENPAQAPSGFLEVVGDYFPVFHDRGMAWPQVACSRCSETSSRGTKRSAANQCWNNYRIVQMSDSRDEIWYQIERHTQVAGSQSSKQVRGTWRCDHPATRADKRSVRA